MSEWVSRIGKMFLLAAGVTVLVDLIDPDRLRGWGANASRRLTEASRQLRLAKIERRLYGYSRDLFSALVSDVTQDQGGFPESVFAPSLADLAHSIKRDDHSQANQLAWAHRHLLHRSLATLPTAHSCSNAHPPLWMSESTMRTCHEQFEALRKLVDEFIRERSTGEEREAYGRHTSRQRTIGMIVTGAILVIGGPTVVWLASRFVGSWLGPVLFFLMTVSVVPRPFAYTAGSWLRRLPGNRLRWWIRCGHRMYRWGETYPYLSHGPRIVVAWQFFRSIPSRLVAKPVAAVLDKTRPGHRLRWLGLGVFVAGSFMDLIGSW